MGKMKNEGVAHVCRGVRITLVLTEKQATPQTLIWVISALKTLTNDKPTPIQKLQINTPIRNTQHHPPASIPTLFRFSYSPLFPPWAQ